MWTQPCCQGFIFSPDNWLTGLLLCFLFAGGALSVKYAACRIYKAAAAVGLRNVPSVHAPLVGVSAVAGRNAGIIFPPLSSLWKWEGVRLCETCTLVQLQLEMYEGKAATQNFHYH